jgi:hypothetical protein
LAQVLDRVRPAMAKLRALPSRVSAVPMLASRLRELRALAESERGKQLERTRTVLVGLATTLRAKLASPDRFNTFEVLELQRREYVHSNVLAWLLDPTGSHGLNSEVLTEMCHLAGLPNPNEPVRVRREEVGRTSIIDIIVEMRDAVLIIEKKVDAAEGERQTEREWEDFAPRAQGRPFKALLLAPERRTPGDRRFTARGYDEVWRLLGRVHADARVQPFIDHYRHILDRRLLGGRMSKFRGLTAETKFILENFEDIRLIQEAVDDAAANVRGLVVSLGDELKKRSWWSDEWCVDVGTNEINVWKAVWGVEEPKICFGVTDIGLEAIGGGPTKAWSYVFLAAALRGVRASDGFARAGKSLGQFDATAKYPVWRHLALDGKAGSDDVRDAILTELDAFVEKFTTAAEALLPTPKAGGTR